MASALHHYLPVPMDGKWREPGRGLRGRCLAAAALVIVFHAVLVTLLIYFAVRANGEACGDGLRAREECRNATRLLQRQLTRAQDGLLRAETEADTCNRTVVTLQESLEKKVSQVREQQALIQELEGKVVMLNQELERLKLQELEKLRATEEASRTLQKNSASSVVVSTLLMLTVLLFLLF